MNIKTSGKLCRNQIWTWLQPMTIFLSLISSVVFSLNYQKMWSVTWKTFKAVCSVCSDLLWINGNFKLCQLEYLLYNMLVKICLWNRRKTFNLWTFCFCQNLSHSVPFCSCLIVSSVCRVVNAPLSCFPLFFCSEPLLFVHPVISVLSSCHVLLLKSLFTFLLQL